MIGEVAFEYRISDGSEGVKETMALMRKIVREYRGNPVVVAQARRLTAGLPEKAHFREVAALFEFVRDDVRYVFDPNDVETLATPDYLLNHPAGDCDDKAILLATLLEAIGHRTRFVAVGFAGMDLSHVYVEALIGGDWIPLETTEGPIGIGQLGFESGAVKARWRVHNS